MSHDASKVLLGSTMSSFKSVDSHAGAIGAGKVVCLTSGDALSTTLSGNGIIGVSLGKDLSDTSRTAIVRRGAKVPVLLGDGETPVPGGAVSFHASSGLALASGGTAVNATYVSGVLTGVLEDGTEANCALIDMPGGL